jgi:hypothetical protein
MLLFIGIVPPGFVADLETETERSGQSGRDMKSPFQEYSKEARNAGFYRRYLEACPQSLRRQIA